MSTAFSACETREFARKWDEHIKRQSLYRAEGYDRKKALAAVLSPFPGPPGAVLDLGTGKGHLARALASRGFKVLSIDLNQEDQRLAAWVASKEGLLDRIDFRHGDLGSLDLEDGSIQAAAMMDVLHHLEAPAPVMREIHRVLEPGGRLLLAEFTSEGFELVGRVQASLGLEHPVGPFGMDAALGALAALGMKRRSQIMAHYHHIALLEKG